MTAEEKLAMREKEINECHTCQRHKELVAEVAKLRKALETIRNSRDRFGHFDGAGAATEAVRIAKEALA
jgi:hypothetical protein